MDAMKNPNSGKDVNVVVEVVYEMPDAWNNWPPEVIEDIAAAASVRQDTRGGIPFRVNFDSITLPPRK